MSLLNNYDTNYIVFLYDHICQPYFLWDTLYNIKRVITWGKIIIFTEMYGWNINYI